MFSLLRGLWDYFFRREEYYILIIGLHNAGKTTFLEQTKRLFISNYNGMPLEKITATVGLNIATVDIRSHRMILWDLGGQEDLQQLWDKYYGECHGVVYVVDSCDTENLITSKNVLIKAMKHQDLQEAPLLILANKQDRQDALPLTQLEATLDTNSATIGGRDCKIQRVSALQGEGVKEGIEWLFNRVNESSRRLPKLRDND
ncbi:ADP-ribosylation factor-related protein 1-like [Dysidea avara]|uniref:ADP-ribosylation factor-related protein 1-like n=1 Tax=Dysidea avara TaxID=196820 RepID=UPI00331C19B9